MAQQTAVEWFFDKLKNHEIQSEHFELYQQAKEMEKEQIIKAACYEPFLGDFPRKEGEHYYNKTYQK